MNQYSKYNEQLKKLRELIDRRHKLRVSLDSLYPQKRELYAKERELASLLRMEQHDVDRLEKGGLASFFYSLTGKKDEKLDRERADVYAAAAKHSAALRELEAVNYDIESAEAEFETLAGCEEEYHRILGEKALLIKSSEPEKAAEIIQLEEQTAYIKNQYAEIGEAISAGNSALASADSILGALSSARDWSTFDILGGGVVSHIAKHSHLDSAQDMAEDLQIKLRRFKTELADISIYSDMQIQVTGFLRFADWFFDGLIVDFTVQNRIENSMAEVQNTKYQIENVLDRLKGLRRDTETELAALEDKLSKMVSDFGI